jgi:predicted amidophosphoribosyltransferase
MKYNYNSNNRCASCGAPISDEHEYCYDCAFDECKCGNRKKVDEEYCRDCEREIKQAQNKIEYGFGICPLCGKEFNFSPYLYTVIPDEKARLIANLITHYRHIHQPSWNQSCHFIAKKYGHDAYEEAKKDHNNRAKRQIIRKCRAWLDENEIKAEHILMLSDNDEKTVKLIEEKLSTLKCAIC